MAYSEKRRSDWRGFLPVGDQIPPNNIRDDFFRWDGIRWTVFTPVPKARVSLQRLSFSYLP